VRTQKAQASAAGQTDGAGVRAGALCLCVGVGVQDRKRGVVQTAEERPSLTRLLSPAAQTNRINKLVCQEKHSNQWVSSH